MKDGFKVIDADGHFYEPQDIWDKYVEGPAYDRRPIVTGLHGNSLFQIKGREMKGGPLGSKVLFDQMEEKFGHAFRDNWSMGSRIKDMETHGWDIQVCLPTNASGVNNIQDVELSAALCRAYNNWAYEFSQQAPTRVKFTSLAPGADLKEMVNETRRSIAELGAVSVNLPPAIPDKMWHHPDYDSVWRLAEELDFPLSIHGGVSASGQPMSNARYAEKTGALIALRAATGFPVENMMSMGHFMLTGILDRFPKLKLLVLEGNCGWVPFWLNRLASVSEGRQNVFFDSNPLELSPQEYFLRNISVAADADEPTIKYVVDFIGNDNIVFNTDYPHPDAPASHEPVQNMIDQPLTEEDKRKILWDNSVKIYGKKLIEGHPLASI
ncbi:amidohydrolase [SAR202 cluster bacterium AC-409-J13_OGT_754m]|nr:amidohydrolase [SAR202 cluster bacterium AC-409-J13_OGT_754m]